MDQLEYCNRQGIPHHLYRHFRCFQSYRPFPKNLMKLNIYIKYTTQLQKQRLFGHVDYEAVSQH
jgi:hypothetical protein